MKVTSIGGGSGQYGVLEGLKKYAIQHPEKLKQEDISAIVTTTDNGGHTKILIKEREPRDPQGRFLPPGDVRQALCALSFNEKISEWFKIRDKNNESLGNKILSGLFDKYEGDFEKVIEEASHPNALNVKGKVYPCTLKRAIFCGILENGYKIHGEEELVRSAIVYGFPIKEVFIEPTDIEANPKAVEAILNSDKIILSQGSLYTSLIPNLLVKDIAEAIRKSKGTKIYIMNLATQRGETDNFTAKDHIRVIEKYLNTNIDKIIINNTTIPYQARENYRKKGQQIVEIDVEKNQRFVLTDLLLIPEKIDEDTILRHDPYKIADAIINKT